MQVLSQRNKQVINSPGEETSDVAGAVVGGIPNGGEERLSGEAAGAEGIESPGDDEHPAMRGLHAGEFRRNSKDILSVATEIFSL